MLCMEINKNETALLDEITENFPESEIIESNSFGTDTIIQVLIPLTAILAPVVSPVFIKLLENEKVSLKYKGIELSGSYNRVQKLLKQLREDKE